MQVGADKDSAFDDRAQEEAMFDRLIQNRERHAKLMGEMMRRFGVLESDTISMNDAICLEGAARRCMGCRAVEQCERWMTATQGTRGAEAFCPNARTFAAIAGPAHLN